MTKSTFTILTLLATLGACGGGDKAEPLDLTTQSVTYRDRTHGTFSFKLDLPKGVEGECSVLCSWTHRGDEKAGLYIAVDVLDGLPNVGSAGRFAQYKARGMDIKSRKKQPDGSIVVVSKGGKRSSVIRFIAAGSKKTLALRCIGPNAQRDNCTAIAKSIRDAAAALKGAKPKSAAVAPPK